MRASRIGAVTYRAYNEPRYRGDGTEQAPRPPDPSPWVPHDGARVKVLNGRDVRAGQIGTVRRTRLDGGDLLVTVQFDDGTTADYWDDELLQKPREPNGELGHGRE